LPLRSQTETPKEVWAGSRRGRQGAQGAPEGQHTQVGLAARKDQAEPEPAARRACDAIRQPRQPGYQRLPLPGLARPPRAAVGGRTQPDPRIPRTGAGRQGACKGAAGAGHRRVPPSATGCGALLTAGRPRAWGPWITGAGVGFRARAAGAAGARTAAGAALILCLPWWIQGHPMRQGPRPWARTSAATAATRWCGQPSLELPTSSESMGPITAPARHRVGRAVGAHRQGSRCTTGWVGAVRPTQKPPLPPAARAMPSGKPGKRSVSTALVPLWPRARTVHGGSGSGRPSATQGL